MRPFTGGVRAGKRRWSLATDSIPDSAVVSGGGTVNACEHNWVYFPVMASNPERHGRKCSACGERQSMTGPTYHGDGTSTPGTDWAPVSSRGEEQ